MHLSLERQVEAARARLDDLQRRVGAQIEPASVAVEALEEFGTALEELHVAAEEMRVHVDELAAARYRTEVERLRYQELFEFAPDSYLVTDLDGVIVQANHVAAAVLGVRQDYLIGKPLVLFVSNRDNAHAALFSLITSARAMPGAAREAADARGPTCCGLEVEMQPRGGEPFPASVSINPLHNVSDGSPIGLHWLIRDMTERVQAEDDRRRIEARLQEKQRMEMVGTLAGGIAHDFNNLLTVVLGYVEHVLLALPPSSPGSEALRETIPAVKRMAQLIAQLVAYAGKGRLVVQLLDLSSVVREMEPLLAASAGAGCRLSFDLAGGLPLVEADAGQMDQIVTNLVVNSVEAVGDTPGDIVVRTGAMECDRPYLSQATPGADLPEGHYVWLEVADTGCGMTAETLGHIFDPFFSTKFIGRGLGLAAVHGIVRSYHGAICATSQPGQGTTMRVLLPAASM